MRELTKHRTHRTKTWHIARNRFKKRFSAGPLHFERDGKLVDIDLTDRLDRGHCLIDQAPFALRVDPNIPAYRYTNGKGGEVSIELASINGNPVARRRCGRDGRAFVWRGISLNTDCRIQPSRKGVGTYLVLHSADAPRRWRWDIGGDRRLLRPIVGRDSRGKLLEIESRYESDSLVVEWTGRATTSKLLRRDNTWTEDIAWPVRIDPSVNESIVAGPDDVTTAFVNYISTFFNSGTSYITPGFSSYPVFVYAGLRFQTIAIPQGVTIDSATLTLTVSSIIGNPVFRVFAHDIDDAAAWSNPGNLAKDIVKTTAYAQITPTVTGAYSFGITGPVQEVINRTGWASSNNIAFGLFPQNVVSANNIQIAAFEHTTLDEAMLDVVYTVAGGAEVLLRPGGIFGLA